MDLDEKTHLGSWYPSVICGAALFDLRGLLGLGVILFFLDKVPTLPLLLNTIPTISSVATHQVKTSHDVWEVFL